MCQEPLAVGRNWSTGRRKHYDKTCNNCHAARARKHRAVNPTSSRKACKKYWTAHRKEQLHLGRLKRQRLKLEILAHYSRHLPPCCANPFGQHQIPYTDIRALSIDHINGKGTQHRFRSNIGGGHHFYRWLKEDNFPPGYQVLCLNCQFIKREINNENASAK